MSAISSTHLTLLLLLLKKSFVSYPRLNGNKAVRDEVHEIFVCVAGGEYSCYSLADDSGLLAGKREKVGMLNVGRRKMPYDMHLHTG